MYRTQDPTTAALHRVTSPFQAALPSWSSPQSQKTSDASPAPLPLPPATWAGTWRGERWNKRLLLIYYRNTLKGHIYHKARWNLILMCAILTLKLESCFRKVDFDMYIHSIHNSLSLHKQKLHYIFLPVGVLQAYAHFTLVVLKHSFYYIKTCFGNQLAASSSLPQVLHKNKYTSEMYLQTPKYFLPNKMSICSTNNDKQIHTRQKSWLTL